MARKYPKSLGACIDMAYEARAERQAIQRQMEEKLKLKADEEAIKQHILETFKKVDIIGAKGAVASAGVILSIKPHVKDWEAFYNHIQKTGHFDLLERRPARTAYRDRLEAGEAVPGVESYEEVDLSLTKIGEK